MKTLEESAKEGNKLVIQFSERENGFNIRFNGIMLVDCSIENFSIPEAMKTFGKAYLIETPNIEGEQELNKVLSNLLKEGTTINNSKLGTNLIFSYDAGKKLYLATFGFQNSAWIDFVSDNPNYPSFSRYLLTGKSNMNFFKAYVDLENHSNYNSLK